MEAEMICQKRTLRSDPSQRLAAIKTQLSATDYKIIKCSEYQLAGLDAPYDVAALHTERQALRDAINASED